MAFFTKKHKKYAKKYNNFDLQIANCESEHELKMAARTGDIKRIKKAMKEHNSYEYALLLQETPKFRKRNKK